MIIKTKKEFVKENIVDENGEILGEIKFNPNDSRIMSKLSKIVIDLTSAIEKIEKLGDIPEIEEKDLQKLEDFEKSLTTFQKLAEGFSIEEDSTKGVIDDLSEIFGRENIEALTCGTYDIMLLMPLIEFITPHLKQARQKKVSKYMNLKNDEVMD